MRIALIDYGAGNLNSALKALEAVGADVIRTSDISDVIAADKIVLPGVGAFGDCMAGLASIQGMIQALEDEVLQKKKKFLGICVGMQLLADTGYEHGMHKGLGWIPGEVRKLDLKDRSLKIPHMGWNDLALKQDHPLLDGIGTGDDVYFVHSYHFIPENLDDVIATADYEVDVTAFIARDNIAGTQFHPEKSQNVGLQILRNFIKW